jgi:hypothetical protein
MNAQVARGGITRRQTAGILVFVLLCGIPAMEINGFGFGVPFSLPLAVACSALGGALGGVLFCPRPFRAGLIGGLLAGPVGLVAVVFYTHNRLRVANVELVLVQGLASLPGIGIGFLLKRWIGIREGEGN